MLQATRESHLTHSPV